MKRCVLSGVPGSASGSRGKRDLDAFQCVIDLLREFHRLGVVGRTLGGPFTEGCHESGFFQREPGVGQAGLGDRNQTGSRPQTVELRRGGRKAFGHADILAGTPRPEQRSQYQCIEVLCLVNRGITGACGINQPLQAALNPSGEHSVDKSGYHFSISDIGFVTAVNLDDDELAVEFDGRTATYSFGELDELVLGHATTVHKSQGSEYPAVIGAGRS